MVTNFCKNHVLLYLKNQLKQLLLFNKWHEKSQSWKILGSMMDKAKQQIPKQWRIGDTCVTALVTFGGNLFTRNPRNIIHGNEDINDLLSVIIILGINVYGGKTKVLMGRVWMTLEKCTCFEAFTWKVFGWSLIKKTVHRAVLSFYPPQINISSLCTSWYKILWQIYSIRW